MFAIAMNRLVGSKASAPSFSQGWSAGVLSNSQFAPELVMMQMPPPVSSSVPNMGCMSPVRVRKQHFSTLEEKGYLGSMWPAKKNSFIKRCVEYKVPCLCKTRLHGNAEILFNAKSNCCEKFTNYKNQKLETRSKRLHYSLINT